MMKKIYLLLGLTTAAAVGLVSFSGEIRNSSIDHYLVAIISPDYQWTRVAPPGAGTHQHEWKAGTYPSAVVPLKGSANELWMVGQKRSWRSSDGITWEAFDKYDWGERISMAPVIFRGSIWISGGMEYATNKFLNEIWMSRDGKKWERTAEHAEWSPRKGHTVVEWKGQLWLFGGETSVDQDRAPDRFVNDIWTSSDGVSWLKVMDNAPWEVRGNPRVIVFREKLWLVGGQGHSDVWNSEDGKAWTKIEDESPWKDRYDYGLMVLDDLLWVYGGREKNPRNAYNDVWLSSDGKNWIRQTEEAPWTPRSGGFSVAFQNKLFLYGGKHTGHADGFSGDIWTMEKQ